MKLNHVVLAFIPSFAAAGTRRCTAQDSCWPIAEEWAAFNTSIGGHLIASRPAAHVCHGSEYDQTLCDTAKSNWTSSDWRTAQPGAYSAIIWELGQDKCFINSSIPAPCEQGLVADYTVNASSVEHVQKAIRWAAKKDLYLTIKNTGHDHLGRSSGRGAFAIWTHHLKGRTWHEDFVPLGGNGSRTRGVPAVTLKAGEQWLDVYHDADQQGRTVVGGSARTVGAAGGWFTGGGHSAWSHFYGLGVDNVLEVTIVTATGEVKVLNENTDTEHFWAIRGGGGNSWGFITSVTYKTHPLPTHIKVLAAQYNTTSMTARRSVLRRVFQTMPNITDLGFTGYATLGEPTGLIFIQPNATNATAFEAATLLNEIGNMPGVSGGTFTLDFQSWIAYCNAFLQDPNIATNVIDPSRLLTAEILRDKAEDLVQLVFDEYPDLHPGFNFIGKVDSRNRDATAVHPIWRESRAIFSMGTNWADDAPQDEKYRKKLRAIAVSKRLAELVGPNDGTYFNEANPYEPRWKDTFWGKETYARLEHVKERVDPRDLFVCNRCVGGALVYQP